MRFKIYYVIGNRYISGWALEDFHQLNQPQFRLVQDQLEPLSLKEFYHIYKVLTEEQVYDQNRL